MSSAADGGLKRRLVVGDDHPALMSSVGERGSMARGGGGRGRAMQVRSMTEEIREGEIRCVHKREGGGMATADAAHPTKQQPDHQNIKRENSHKCIYIYTPTPIPERSITPAPPFPPSPSSPLSSSLPSSAVPNLAGQQARPPQQPAWPHSRSSSTVPIASQAAAIH